MTGELPSPLKVSPSASGNGISPGDQPHGVLRERGGITEPSRGGSWGSASAEGALVHPHGFPRVPTGPAPLPSSDPKSLPQPTATTAPGRQAETSGDGERPGGPQPRPSRLRAHNQPGGAGRGGAGAHGPPGPGRTPARAQPGLPGAPRRVGRGLRRAAPGPSSPSSPPRRPARASVSADPSSRHRPQPTTPCSLSPRPEIQTPHIRDPCPEPPEEDGRGRAGQRGPSRAPERADLLPVDPRLAARRGLGSFLCCPVQSPLTSLTTCPGSLPACSQSSQQACLRWASRPSGSSPYTRQRLGLLPPARPQTSLVSLRLLTAPEAPQLTACAGGFPGPPAQAGRSLFGGGLSRLPQGPNPEPWQSLGILSLLV
ncbi:collagen alpha-1(I) chain-like [Phocoena sinus]|uniref:collagen alpha-1(I) chain-like n=1 Tax=Phocoena sinus TaxID=42100 RepID=UPI0013C458CD|nr:collagen alpha-1(I) chain-like [Phocoena sinus]